MASLFWVAEIWMVNGPAVPVARTVKLPSQIIASELPVGERMEISAERERPVSRKIKIDNKDFMFIILNRVKIRKIHCHFHYVGM
jgi:hypothetical protein